MGLLKVSSKSSPNQGIKAIAIARGFLIPCGLDITCAPTFSDIEIAGESRTAIKIAIYVHTLSAPDAQAPVVSSTEFDEVL